jgi:hypothetical protein
MKKRRIELRFNHSTGGRRRKRVLVPPAQRQPAQNAGAPPRRRGAQLGNQNALKHGHFTHEMKAFRAKVRAYVRQAHALVRWERHLTDLLEERRKRTAAAACPARSRDHAPDRDAVVKT